VDETEEPRYLRLGADGKTFYITRVEAMKEEVLAGPREELSQEAILISEWNYRVERAEQLREQISLVHKMMRVDEQRPSQYRADYDTLWDEYRDAIDDLREIDFGSVDEFKDKVVARLKELEDRISSLNDLNDPDYFDYYEKTLTLYEKIHDQAVALGWQPPQPVLPEAKYPCYKADDLCRLAGNGPLSECIYEPDACPWQVRVKSRQDGISKQERI